MNFKIRHGYRCTFQNGAGFSCDILKSFKKQIRHRDISDWQLVIDQYFAFHFFMMACYTELSRRRNLVFKGTISETPSKYVVVLGWGFFSFAKKSVTRLVATRHRSNHLQIQQPTILAMTETKKEFSDSKDTHLLTVASMGRQQQIYFIKVFGFCVTKLLLLQFL